MPIVVNGDPTGLPTGHTPPTDVDRDTPYVLGIDEAGRGAVMGPMTYGVAWCRLDMKEEIKKIGFMDSKMLNEKNRSKLLVAMSECKNLHWAVDSIPSAVIGAQMLQQERYNLNAISHDSAIGLIRMVLAMGFNIAEIYVDTVGSEEIYEKKLQMLFPGIACTVCKKADSIFPIVSAASIGAKVSRDKQIETWSYEPGELLWDGPVGSGYPGDAITKEWLSKNIDEFWGPPSSVRFSWRPVKDIMKEQCVEVDYGIVEEEDEDTEKARQSTGGGIAQFFGGNADKGSTKRVRGAYFHDRGMEICSDF